MNETLKNVTKHLPHVWIVIVGVLLMLAHALYCYMQSASRTVIIFAFVGLILVVGAYLLYLHLRKRDRKERLFLAAILSLGLCFTFLFPPGTVPDEIYHYEASYAYSNGTPQLTEKQLQVRASDAEFISNMHIKFDLKNLQKTQDQIELFSNDSALTTISAVSNFSINSNMPQVKFASALGIALGKALSLSPLITFYLGRLFNLLLFILLAYWAVRLTPVGKNIFIVVALLPMTLHLAASYSYDAGIIGYAFMFTALCLKTIYERKIQPPIVFIGIIVFGLLLAPCKSVYFPLLLLALFIPKSAFARQKNSKWFKTGLLLGGLAMIGAFTLSNIIGVASTPATTNQVSFRGSEAGRFYGVSDLVGDPIKTLHILFNTVEEQSWFYLTSLTGSSLGWFQFEIKAPEYFVVVLSVVILLSFVNHPGDKTQPRSSLRIILLVIFGISTLGSVFSMFLSHTFVTEYVVAGVQGRYFLPVLPLALLALRTKYLQFTADPKNWLIQFLVWFNALYLLFILTKALIISY